MRKVTDATPNPAAQILPFVRCPSDTGSPLLKWSNVSEQGLALSFSDVLPNRFARSNYVGVAGANPPGTIWPTMGWFGIWSHALGDPGGPFFLNTRTGFRDMTDGASNTLLVGERYSPLPEDPAPAAPSIVPIPPIGHATWIGLPNLEDLSAVLGDVAARLDTPQPSVFGPSSYTLNGNNLGGSQSRGMTTGFGSMHTGGATFLLGDGAVRFLSNSIDVTTYRNLGRISDGNPLGEF